MNDKEYELWKKTVEKIVSENKTILEEFEFWLQTKKLSIKTINNHIFNIDFFINDYLVRYEPIKAKDGAYEIGSFLGDFYIRKAMWASKSSLMENIVSFKKFYTFMVEANKTNIADFHEMKEIIKNEREEWFNSLEQFDSLAFDYEIDKFNKL
ncbi:MAG: recombinase [Paludibacter sp.]|nr:recombinase [Paludibacter sp.]